APPPLHLREPGSTAGGERIRALVLDPDVELGRGTLALLFAAARREMLERVVAPALEEGRDVVVERFHPSTFAYQGTGDRPAPERGALAFDDDELLSMLRRWAGAPAPTVEIVLDLDPDEAYARAVARTGGASDRFEGRGPAFFRRVSAGLAEYVARTGSAVTVDASGDEAEVATRVLDAVVARSTEASRA
ncbi:MAG: hypothetical protein AAGA20_21770, partial [Planctomycetota bacterium]